MKAADFPEQWEALVREVFEQDECVYAAPRTLQDGLAEIREALDQVELNQSEGDTAAAAVFNLALVAARAQRACTPLLPKLRCVDLAKLIEFEAAPAGSEVTA